jgi:protoporphyrinogen oxidase
MLEGPAPAPGSPRRIAVIGGGLAGLVAADRLLSAGHSVVVFEKYPAAGGLVGTFSVGGESLERFYHHLFTSDVDYVSLADELGLAGEIEWLPSKMGFFSGGHLYPFGTPASLLGFSPLGVKGRLELVLSTLRLRRIRDWRALEGETAIGWLKENGYGRVLDVVWGPLLTQKYGRRAEEVGLVWLWGKIALRTRSRDKTGLGERLGYMRGSFGRVIEALLTRIASRGGEVRPARPVKIASRLDGGWLVDFRGGSEAFDLVLSTVAIPELLRIAPDLPAEARERWSAISYAHALCPVLVVDRPLTRFYWTNVGDVAMPFGGFIEHTNYIPASRYGGNHVVYLSDYVLPDDPKWTMPDRDLWDLYLPAVLRLAPEFGRARVLERHIFRAEHAQPIVGTHYSRILPPVRTGVPGFYSAAMAQVYPEDRGQNYAVKIAREAATALLEDLR